jgi:hypothetical protein
MSTRAATADLRRALPELYRAGPTPVLVDVPDLPFLRIDGRGDPNTSAAYADALHALYAVAYGIRFALKRGPAGVDAPVLPLEGLWWVPDMALFDAADKSAWHWTLQIPQADAVTGDLVAAAVAAAARKGVARVDAVRFEHVAEGRCAQVLHRGPYADEGPTVAALHAFIAEQGYALTGTHHEIYLGDPRRTAPERLRTIIRQPVAAPEREVRKPPGTVGGPA